MRTLNLLRVVAVAALATLLAPASFAQTSGDVTVKVSLTSKCRFQSGQNVTIDFGTYVAFSNLDVTVPAQDMLFECTRNFASVTPTFAWDTAEGDVNGNGVIAGLSYSLTASGATKSTTGSAATPTNGGGTPDILKVTVGGFMQGGQPGEGSGGAAQKTRTLTVTF